MSLFRSTFFCRTSTTNWVSLWYALCSHSPADSTCILTLSPCCAVVTTCTGVPKSATSNLRRSPSGKEECRKSTTNPLPSWRKSTPTWLLGRLTTIRPAPSGLRRKSTSRKGNVSLLPSWANSVPTRVAVDALAVLATGSKMISSTFPCNSALYEVGCFKFSTRRARSPPSTTLMVFKFPWLTSTKVLPKEFVAFGISKAMRAGAWIAKPVGSTLKGSANSIRTISVPPCSAPAIDWILFCAHAEKGIAPKANKPTAAAQRVSIRLVFLLIIFSPLANQALPDVPPNPRMHPERFPGAGLHFR